MTDKSIESKKDANRSNPELGSIWEYMFRNLTAILQSAAVLDDEPREMQVSLLMNVTDTHVGYP